MEATGRRWHDQAAWDFLTSSSSSSSPLQNVGDLFPPGVFDGGRSGRGGMAIGWEMLSGKMAVLARMLQLLHAETKDRCGVHGTYDIMQYAHMVAARIM